MEWLFIVFVVFAFVLWCCLRMADKSDEKIEEQNNYQGLDPKSLDDDIMIDNFMEENIYEKENEEDIPKGRETRSKSSK